MQDKIILAAAQENAKVREELVTTQRLLALKDETATTFMNQVKDLQAQLAHQPLDSARDKQPSAITTNEQAYRDGTLSQPSVCPKCGYKSCLDLSSPSLQQPVKAQQPSAFVGKKPCKRCGVFFYEDEKECPNCSEPRQPSATVGLWLPSAPTAECDKCEGTGENTSGEDCGKCDGTGITTADVENGG